MAHYEILSCEGGGILWGGDAPSFASALKTALREGIKASEMDLTYIHLEEADLSGLDLSGANLYGAALSEANLAGSDLAEANLCYLELSGADLRGTRGLPEAPVIPDLDKKILKKISNGEPRLGDGHDKPSLYMDDWHSCDTVHCRAGWAIVLAGKRGRELEIKFGSEAAGALIYAASYPDMRVPDFYASDEEALEDIKARAALCQEP